MWCDPNFYRGDEAVLKRLLRPGDNFVDVGANVGALTIVGSKLVGPKGRVFSIEPHPRTVKYLRGNVMLNKAANVEIINAAAGDMNAETHLTDRRCDDQNLVSTTGVKVSLRTLDSLLPDISVRILKIDVEGFELFVLKGAERILKRTEFVYFESWESHFVKCGYRTGDIIDFLEGHRFRLNCGDNYVSGECENLLAVKEGTA